jgi:putative oxidoreductase
MTATDTGLLILRLCLGGIMLAHATNHLALGGKVAGTARWFAGLGLRHSRVQAWASIITEAVGGCGLLLGLLTPLAAAACVGSMSVAFCIAHRKNGFFVFRDGYEYVLMISAVAVSIAITGPGLASVDHVAGIAISGAWGAAIALIGGIGGAAALLAATWRPGQSISRPTTQEPHRPATPA